MVMENMGAVVVALEYIRANDDLHVLDDEHDLDDVDDVDSVDDAHVLHLDNSDNSDNSCLK